MSMIEQFFTKISTQSSFPNLQEISGTCRWEIKGVGSWLLEIKRGRLALAKEGESRKEADATIKCSKEDFDLLIQQKLHPMVAFLQGRLVVSGDLSLAQLCMRGFRFQPYTQMVDPGGKEEHA